LVFLRLGDERLRTSQSEPLRHQLFQPILGHGAVDLDDPRLKTLRFLSVRYGPSAGARRLPWSAMTSSVAYRRRPCRAATRRAMTDLPAPLPPPIQ
jgi:hypothetical protein